MTTKEFCHNCRLYTPPLPGWNRGTCTSVKEAGASMILLFARTDTRAAVIPYHHCDAWEKVPNLYRLQGDMEITTGPNEDGMLIARRLSPTKSAWVSIEREVVETFLELAPREEEA